MIAHRLSTLNSCDRIIHLEKGNIIQDGPPKEVIPQLSTSIFKQK